MDFGKAFTFAFEDEGWIRKLGLGGLFAFIGMLLLFIPGILYILGYQIAVGRRVYMGDKQALPEPDNFGEFIKDGLVVFAISFIYALPAIIVALPFTIVGIVLSENGASEAFAGIMISIGSCLSILLGLSLAFFLPAAMAQYIRTGEFGACLRVGEIWNTIVRPEFVNLLLMLLAVIAAQLIVQLVVGLSVITICGPILLAFPASVWTSAFTGHLYGQLAALGGGVSKADSFDFA
ncbi:MAG: DUF4013 domain-containing protein [Ardenticatenaceae bacterium]|nr:DUF4013 domain-containing protein [Ardenticatenaceae bacterium]